MPAALDSASRPGRTLPKTRVWASEHPDPSNAPGEPPVLAAFRIWPGAGVTTTTRRGVPDYLRARYYDPTTGQFLSRDPAVASTRQPYAYSLDNPLNMTDPSGLDAFGDFQNFVIGAAHVTHTERAVAAAAVVAGTYYGAEHTAAAWVGENGANIATGCTLLGLGGGEALAPVFAGCAFVAGSASAAYEFSNGKPWDAAWDGSWAAIGGAGWKSTAVTCAGLAADAGKRIYDWSQTSPKNPTRYDQSSHPGVDY